MEHDRWLYRAKSSLKISKTKSDEDVFYEDFCFQAQLAVKRAFKGLLIFYGVDPRKTDDLVLLIKELSKYTNLPGEVYETPLLNNYDYVLQTINHGEEAPVEEEEYKKTVIIAEKCVKWVEKKINDLIENTEENDNQLFFNNTELKS